MSQAGQTIAILYNVVDASDREDINSIIEGVTGVKAALDRLGHQSSLIRVNDGVLPLVTTLSVTKPDLVFNLCEGYDDRSEGEVFVAGLLELLRIPYTGSAPSALALGLEKSRTKALLSASGIPTPRSVLCRTSADAPIGPRFPLMLKLDREDASLGITPANVVADEAALRQRLGELLEAYQTPVLVEEFVDGREFTVAILDGTPIALEEIEFDVSPRIVCYRAKWEKASPQYRGTRASFTPVVTGIQRQEMLTLATRVYELLGIRDYGRVDFRMDQEGHVFVLEANPNPDITPDSGYQKALDAAGISYQDFIARLVRNALARA